MVTQKVVLVFSVAVFQIQRICFYFNVMELSSKVQLLQGHFFDELVKDNIARKCTGRIYNQESKQAAVESQQVVCSHH